MKTNINGFSSLERSGTSSPVGVALCRKSIYSVSSVLCPMRLLAGLAQDMVGSLSLYLGLIWGALLPAPVGMAPHLPLTPCLPRGAVGPLAL